MYAASSLTFEVSRFIYSFVIIRFDLFVEFGVSQRRLAESVLRIGHRNKQWREAPSLIKQSK